MPLADHLRELRNRLMKAVLAILAVAILGLVYYKQIADFLTEPMRKAVGCEKGFGESVDGEACAEITLQGLVAPFTVMLKVALTVGVIGACPVWLYQLWAFLAPGLHRSEKKYAGAFVGAGVPLFVGGAVLAYLVLPTAARALLDFTPEDTGNLIPFDNFLDITTRLVIVFGLAFELPLLLVMLNFGGIVSGRQLLSWWRVMVVAITVFSAMATPTGDPLTMCALALPIVLLYFGATGVALYNDSRRRRANPYTDLDDDEASSLDHAPEPVGQPGSVTDADSRGDEGGTRDRFDDAT